MLTCASCQRPVQESELKHLWPNIPKILERLDPGGTVPHGECPHCGALIYEKKDTVRVMRCRVCREIGIYPEMRDHLHLHNPNADNLDVEEIREQFEWQETASPIADRISVLNLIDATEIAPDVVKTMYERLHELPPAFDNVTLREALVATIQFVVDRLKVDLRKQVMEQ